MTDFYERLEARLARKAGLTPVGRTEDGEMEYVGPDEAWDRFEEIRDSLGILADAIDEEAEE
jgi:hypothetical protein